MAGVRVQRGPSLWRIGPGYLVVAAVDGRCVEIGGSASAVWQALPAPQDDPVELDALVARLAAEHDVPRDVATGDAESVLRALEAIGCAVRHA